jgi:hypothetical protein
MKLSRYPPAVWLAVPLILLFFFLALDSMTMDSPTMDEPNHIARGLALLRTGDPRFSLEHPPLVNSLSALPLLMLRDLSLPTDDPSWEQPEGWYRFAELLLWEYNADVTRMVFLARLPVVFLTIFLGLVGYRFAMALWGSPAGLLALLMLLFDPNVLAHGRYSTTDVGGAAFLLLATFMLWRLWSYDGWSISRLLAAGVSLGLAFAGKLSTLAFVPIFTLLSLLPLYPGRWRVAGSLRRLLQFGLTGLIALAIVWAAYGFQWGAFRFSHDPFVTLNRWAGPMPTYWAGIEQILGLSSQGRGAAFLLGEFSTAGFPAYFPVAFLVKTPLATLIMLPVAAILLLGQQWSRKRALFLLIPAVFFFLLSMQSALNIGYRHLLPSLVLCYILIAGLGTFVARPVPAVSSRSGRALTVTRLVRILLLVALPALMLATLSVHPHYLSYFNRAAGGPANGYRMLIDSNVDWGQDLLRLKEWMSANDVDRIKLSWFGSADPAYYGIDYEPLPGLPRHFDLWWDVPFDPVDPEPGVYAISVSNLWEIPLQEEKHVFPWFREHKPDDRVGYSILIYRVPGG